MARYTLRVFSQVIDACAAPSICTCLHRCTPQLVLCAHAPSWPWHRMNLPASIPEPTQVQTPPARTLQQPNAVLCTDAESLHRIQLVPIDTHSPGPGASSPPDPGEGDQHEPARVPAMRNCVFWLSHLHPDQDRRWGCSISACYLCMGYCWRVQSPSNAHASSLPARRALLVSLASPS